MVDLYLMSRTDRGMWLKKSLEGSLPGLKVDGAVLEGRASLLPSPPPPTEGQRFRQDMAGLKERRGPTYGSVLDYDGVLREHMKQK